MRRCRRSTRTHRSLRRRHCEVDNGYFFSRHFAPRAVDTSILRATREQPGPWRRQSDDFLRLFRRKRRARRRYDQNPGWQLDNFLTNPVFLWAHDAGQPPIGRVSYVNKVGSELRGAVRYATADEYPFADTIYRLTKGGFINAVSVSWLPLNWNYSTDKNRPGGVDFLEQELLEVSAVPLPSLPTALATSRGAGLNVAPLAAWAERELDLGRSPINRRELEAMRAIAAPTSRSIYYSTNTNSLVRRENRVAAAPITPISRGLFRSFGEFLNAVARGAIEMSGRQIRDLHLPHVSSAPHLHSVWGTRLLAASRFLTSLVRN